jgi:hypothetical protein
MIVSTINGREASIARECGVLDARLQRVVSSMSNCCT